MTSARVVLVITIHALLGAAACSTPDVDARVDPVGPDRATFAPVAGALVRGCGSLDCHGSRYRNLRLYGYGGLRLAPNALPEHQGKPTTAEVAANYDAVVGLEPEIMRAVVAERGAEPERLTLIRKARGAEAHKGNDPVKVGDDADRCLVTWLASATDTDACERAFPLRSAPVARDAGAEAGSADAGLDASAGDASQ